MSDQVELISLAELIEQIKTDLLTNAVSDNPAFFIDGIEVTAQVVARRDRAKGGKASTGINLAVLGLRADAGLDIKTALGSQLTQTVTIKLSPLLTKDESLGHLDPTSRYEVEHNAAEILIRGARGESPNAV
ncbi:trypco2 family protein [Candidatus Thiosymbion oneisti]|uniref:trypco2 family protein n=1 Tax=Candidatus Thiosymbion oneisti TaxID=589554 RepID=UPI00105E27CA|nr:trypco2 family protein [Candidatus Thiosymbion oneisti]